MIVLFMGAGGTGKTTLAQSLVKRYGTYFLKSTSRAVQQQFGVQCEDDQLKLTPARLSELQIAISNRYWDDCEFAATRVGGYVSDRTIADHFCYRMMKGWNEISEEELLTWAQRITTQLRSADLVIYCPTGIFTPPDDEFRTLNTVQRTVFDFLIRGVVDSQRSAINLLPLTVQEHDTRLTHIHAALLNVDAIPVETKADELLKRPDHTN